MKNTLVTFFVNAYWYPRNRIMPHSTVFKFSTVSNSKYLVRKAQIYKIYKFKFMKNKRKITKENAW